ncbi:MAG: aromatic ring-hydroxylating dioxygenase subunit alpha, partial [Acidimicrobiales bacterium]
MPHFTKPAEGSWTEHFGLDTGPVSYADSTSPEHYELEQEAIFRKTWLNVGRVEQLPKNGSYFTKELDAANTSVVLVRDMEGEVRAFHNMCRHRGNKLVWNDYPGEEVSGTCRQFTCKYHGWRYGLEGQLTFVQQEGEFFDLDKDDFGLAGVNVDVWEGFIFVNFDPEAPPLKEYMGRLGAGIEGYPFHLMTQKHTYKAEIGANWKLFIDAFMEFYHAPVLHAKQATDEESRKLQGYGFEALAYDVDGPHSLVSSWGGMAPPKDLGMVKPIERVLRSGLFGVWDAPDIGELPEGLFPALHPALGEDSVLFLPNLSLLVWKPYWYLSYHYWPT